MMGLDIASSSEVLMLRQTRSFNVICPAAFRPALVCGVCLLAIVGCRSGDTHQSARTADTVSSRGEHSVKPGINAGYDDPDIDTWIKRFESEERGIFTHRERIVDSLGLRSGMVVGDIGAGTGLFVPLFSQAVGSDGKVLAVDITPDFLDLIRARSLKAGLRNVQTVLCAEDSVTLPPASIDLAFICATYHHFEYPQSTMSSVHRALRPGGEVVIIDLARIPGQSREWTLKHVRAGEEAVVKEMRASGFALTDDQPDDSYLEENYILRFRKVQ